MAIVLLFSSFSNNFSEKNETNEIKNKNLKIMYDLKTEKPNCWQMATSESEWYVLEGGSYEFSQILWDIVYSMCSAEYYGIPNCNGC